MRAEFGRKMHDNYHRQRNWNAQVNRAVDIARLEGQIGIMAFFRAAQPGFPTDQ